MLLFPAYLFIKRDRIHFILPVACLCGLLTESLHGFLIGTLVTGVGMGVLLLQMVDEMINWKFFGSQALGLFGYLVSIVFVRVAVIRMIQDAWIMPSVFTFVVSYLGGCAVLFLHLAQGGNVSSDKRHIY